MSAGIQPVCTTAGFCRRLITEKGEPVSEIADRSVLEVGRPHVRTQ